MAAKIGSFLATLLLSIPLAAVGLMAVFGVPQVVPAGNDPRDSLNRGPARRSLWESITGDNFSQPDRNQEQVGWDDAPRFASNAAAPFDSRQPVAPAGHSLIQNPPPANSAPLAAQPPHYLSIPEAPPRNPPAGAGGGNFGMTPREAALADARLAPVENIAPVGNQPQLNWQQAQLQLTQLGIDDFHVTRGASPGSFLVACAYAPPESPQVVHRFEAEASDPLVAANRVLGQIQRWMETRLQAANYPVRNSRLSGGNDPFSR